MTPRTDHDPLDDAPLLRSIPKAAPFVVPDGFFDRFPMEVQAAIAADRPVRTLAKWQRLAWLRPAALGGALAALGMAAWLLIAPERAPDLDTMAWATEAVMDDPYLLADTPGAEALELPGIAHDLSADEVAAYLANERTFSLDLIAEIQ
jgi:hypothetical protein